MEAPAALAEAWEVTTGGGLLSRAFRQVWAHPGSLLNQHCRAACLLPDPAQP